MGFPADRAGGARKKFFSPNPVEFWLDAWWKDARKFWLGLPRSTLQYESHLLSMNAEHPQIS